VILKIVVAIVEIFSHLSVLFVNNCLSLFKFWQSKKQKVLQSKANVELVSICAACNRLYL